MAGAIVQIVGADSGAGGTTIASGAFGSNVTAGNTLVFETTGGGTGTVTISKNAGTATIGAVTHQASQVEAGTGKETQYFTCVVTGTGTFDGLATWGASQTSRAISQAELSGIQSFTSLTTGTDTGNNPTTAVNATVTVVPAFGLALGNDVQGAATLLALTWTDGGITGANDSCRYQSKSFASTGVQAVQFDNHLGFDRANIGVFYFLESGPPTFTLQPFNKYIDPSQVVTFTATAVDNGGTSLAYQWQDNRGGSFANCTDGSGATTATYTSGPFTASSSGRQYRCVATDTLGSTNSVSATVTFGGGYSGQQCRRGTRRGGMNWGLNPIEWW